MSEHQPPAWPSYFTDLNLMVRVEDVVTLAFGGEGLECLSGCTLQASCTQLLAVCGPSAVHHSICSEVYLMPAALLHRRCCSCRRALLRASAL